MKKSIAFLTFLFLSGSLYAQFTYGIKAGLNLSSLRYEILDLEGTHGFSPSFHVGMYGNLDVSDNFAFSADFLISDKGYKEESTTHLLYANVPFTAHFKPVKNLSVGLGPSLGFLITHWGKERESAQNLYTNRFDFGAVAGLQYSITPSIAVAVRYEHGFSNVIGEGATIKGQTFNGNGDLIWEDMYASFFNYKSWNQNFQLSVCYALK
jgi:hypothetical protein